MIKHIKNTFLLSKIVIWQIPALILGAGLLGTIISVSVSIFIPDAKTYVPMGTIFVIMAALFLEVISIASLFWIDFEMGLKMGVTRKKLIVSQTVLSIAHLVLAIVIVAIYSVSELVLSGLAFSGGSNLFEDLDISFVLIILPLIMLFLLGFGMLFGSMAQRFGKGAIATIYLGSLSIVFLSTAVTRFTKKDGFFGEAARAISTFLASFTGRDYGILAIILSIVMIIISTLLLLRARIKA